MTKKLKAKGRAILRARTSIKVPEFNVMDYNISLIRALNYYSLEVENKDKRQYAIAYWKKQGKDTSKLTSLSDSWFSTVGAVAHMAINEVPLHDHDLIRLDNAYEQLVEVAKKEKIETEQKEADSPKQAKKSIQDYMDEAASQHIGEIEGAIDELITKGTVFDAKTYLTANQVKAPVAKKIAEWFKGKMNEFKSAIDDKEMCDAYGGKRLLNKLITQTESIVADCGTIAIIAKTTRTPRIRKPQPPTKLVAKMKWMKEYVDLKMKSIFPEKIIGATELWLYDTMKRRLIRYVAQDGMELSVKGTTIMNFNPEKSGSKIVRKPEILNGHENMSKRPLNNIFNEIKATLGKLNGRTNENQIILKVF